MKLKSLLLIALLAATSACTLAWGKSYNVVEATPDVIGIKFYRASVNGPRMNQEAADHCAKYAKNAVLEKTTGNDEFINTYRCVAQTGYRPVITQPETLN